jgi:hypothetical protein
VTRAAWLVASVLPGLTLLILLHNLATWFPAFTEHLMHEDGPIEWWQVALALVGAVLVVRAAVRRFVPGDVLLAAVLVELAVAEVDLDRRIFGVAVIDWKFVTQPRAPLPYRVLAGTVIVATLAGLLAYAAWNWRPILADALDGLRGVWGPLVATGALLFAIPQPCERCLNIGPYPPYLIEETLEVLGTLYLALGMAVRMHDRLSSTGGAAALSRPPAGGG